VLNLLLLLLLLLHLLQLLQRREGLSWEMEVGKS